MEVETQKNHTCYKAIMDSPHNKLHDGQVPVVEVESRAVNDDAHYTKITILGYNGNKMRLFNHDRLKDYILWFTKMGVRRKRVWNNDT